MFPSNDTNENDWMTKMHPIFVKHGNVHIFAGDASLTTKYEIDGVNYYTTGLRQKSKGDWIIDDMQSYLLCGFESKKNIKCDIKYFKVDKPGHSKIKSEFDEIISSLSNQSPIYAKDIHLNVKSSISGEHAKILSHILLLRNWIRACDFTNAKMHITAKGNINRYRREEHFS